MSVTIKLYRLFLVDRRLRSLRSRLNAAERFLGQQVAQLEALDKKRGAVEAQIRQLKATIGDHEGEAARLTERIDHLREQMNAAKTNKEYKAFLSELNTFGADKEREEAAALELMGKIDELEAELSELETEKAERDRMRGVAEQERGERAKEIKGQVEELEGELAKRREETPADGLRAYDDLIVQHPDEDPMAPIEILNKRRHEYTCGSCMITIPMEAVSALLSHGGLTRCPSCGVILYLEEDTIKALQPA